MAVLTADFEAGVNGANILAADPGSLTAWNLVTPVDGTIKYDNTHVAHGNLSAKLASSPNNGVNMDWTTALGTVTNYYGRQYFYITANPASNLGSVIGFSRSGGTGFAWGLGIATSGQLFLQNQAFGTIATFAASVTLNQWWRVEYHADHAAQSLEVRLFLSMDSVTPTETSLTPSGASIGADANDFRPGIGILNYTLWTDDIVTNATTWPGPVAGPAALNVAGPAVIGGRFHF